MKKQIQIKLPYLFAAVVLFIVYHSWVARHHDSSFAKKEQKDQNQFNGNTSACSYKNGNYAATIDYFNLQTKAEETFHAEVEIENCNIVEIKFRGENKMNESIILPAELENNGQVTTEDSGDGIYMIRLD